MSSRKKHSIAVSVALTTIISASACPPAAAAPRPTHFWLCAHHNWAAKKGYFLIVESMFEDGAPARLAEARLVLAVGDGHDFRYLRSGTPFVPDREYSAKATITSESAELWLDDRRIAQADGAFVPVVPLQANAIPAFVTGPSDYIVIQNSIRIGSGQRVLLEKTFENDSSINPLSLFAPVGSITQDVPLAAPVTIETRFRLLNRPDLRSVSPLIDRYGQARHASFAGKITNDDELVGTIADEDRRLAEWGEQKALDRFGGSTDAGWKEKATGFFRVLQRDGKWWLISPDGNPTFYLGICAAPDLLWPPTPVNQREFLWEYLPPRDGKFAACWAHDIWSKRDGQDYVSFHALNMMRKYGDDWQDKANRRTRRRANVLGFGGYAKWSQGNDVTTLPVLHHGEVPNLAGHPDVFDPAVQSKFRAALVRQIEPHKNDPFVMGWSVGNELDECVSPGEVRAILAMDDGVPARHALVEHYLKSIRPGANGNDIAPTPEELEQLRGFYASKYYEFIYKMVKEADPNHLYFGFWPAPGYWINENDWRWVAPYCDVIGYDFYSGSFENEPTGRLIKEFKKPVLNGEFSHPPNYGGARGFGSYGTATPTEAEAGERYVKWIKDAATNPYCVGLFYFAYRDQPLTGRGPGTGQNLVHGEDFAFGLVDITDRLKWDFVTRVREANLQAVQWRCDARVAKD